MDTTYSNALINETSPYLLQHAHNPVNWYAWGEEAFERARKENKLVLVSIGYSSCHWCHVMERESFEAEDIAQIMNENFICIKVDREERPDVDQLYMDAVMLMTGSGGWPLNAFTLPDKRPVYGGTYFPPGQWKKVLKQLRTSWEKHPEKVYEYADNLTEGIQTMNLIEAGPADTTYSPAFLHNFYSGIEKMFDTHLGGTKNPPKFPMPVIYEFLLTYHSRTANEQALEQVFLTLDRMAQGGIFDQIGGGFSRYSTDADWLVPHFEKMLYDNGQLLNLYANAYKLNPNPLYKEVIYKTTGFLEREMTNEEGGFFSALDADSEGEEGKYYVWTEQEIKHILKDDAAIFNYYYGVGNKGHWEHGNNILTIAHTIEEVAEKFNLPVEEVEKTLQNAGKRLLKEREKRVRPGLDDKTLASWNALTISGLITCWQALGDEHFLRLAQQGLNFIEDNLLKEKKLYRTYKAGKATIPAFIEDYALVIKAYLDYYQATLQPEKLNKASELTDSAVGKFFNPQHGYFEFSDRKEAELIANKSDVTDNVIPSPNSVMAHNLFILGKLYDKANYTEMAGAMLNGVLPAMEKPSPYYSNWAILYSNNLEPYFEIAVAGANADELVNNINLNFIPNKLIVGCTEEDHCFLPLLENKFVADETLIYVCVHKTCDLPVMEVSAALDQLNTKNKPLK